MSRDPTTTISVNKTETYPELSRLRRQLSTNEPGGKASMDDVIRYLLDRAEEGPETEGAIEESEEASV